MQRFVALVLLGTFLCALVPPVYTDTTTTVPPTTQPETTVPPTTQPETTVPPTTLPETTVPPTTQTETTVPPTTQTETTGPPTTLPETTVPPTTQPKSTALPTVTPKEINVTVVDEGKACLIATMEAALTITYEKTDNTSVKITLPIPQPKTVPGRCASAKNPTAEFTLAVDAIELRLIFSQKDGVAYLETAVLNYTLDKAIFPDAKIQGQKVSEKADLKLRLAKTTEFFQCKSPIVEAIGKTSTITFDTLKIQVFNVVNGTYSKDKGMCPQDAPTGPPTTAAPTTAPPKPTTTPKPSPPAKPMPGNWTVEGKDGVICVVLHLGVRFTKKKKVPTATLR